MAEQIIRFACQCGKKYSIAASNAGLSGKCKRCGRVLTVTKGEQPQPLSHQKHDSKPLQNADTSRFPIVISSSARALYGKHFWEAFAAIVFLVIAIVLTLSLWKKNESGTVIFLVWFLYLILLAIASVRMFLDYLRMKHTVYRIFPKMIEGTSYLFRFLGVENNVVNLTQLRQIQAYSNSLLDVWFFGCGKVLLTVSGDMPDFEIENVYMPHIVKRQIEEVIFGTASAHESAAAPPDHQ